jgi:hypothetical protein
MVIRGQIWAAPAFVLLFSFVGCAAGPQSPRFDFSLHDIEAIEVAFPAHSIDARSSDGRAIRSLLETLSAAIAHPTHKCESIGKLIVCLKWGRREEFGLLAGHGEDTFEFRYRDELYRLPRETFAAALRAIGVERLPR